MANHKLAVIVFLTLLVVAPNMIQNSSMSGFHPLSVKTSTNGSLIPHGTIWINGDEMFREQADLEGWPGNGTQDSPYIISGYYFNTWDKPLTIYHATAHWIFTNNLIDGEDDHGGTWIQNCTNGAIINNEICNRRFAIAIARGSGINITGNYIHDCWENGIEFVGGMNSALVQNNVIENIGVAGFYSGLSRDTILANNTFTKCGTHGLALLGVTSNCTITENTISNCGTENIEGIGVRVSIFETSEISSNRIKDTTSYGILIDSGNNSSITSNTITNCSGYAVTLLSESNQILVKFNTFIDTGLDCQVLDNGTLNEFSHNFYSDWTTPDGNADGYVDVPYQIEGSSGATDMFPLVNAGVIPVESTRFSMDTIVASVLVVGLVIVFCTLYKRRN